MLIGRQGWPSLLIWSFMVSWSPISDAGDQQCRSLPLTCWSFRKYRSRMVIGRPGWPIPLLGDLLGSTLQSYVEWRLVDRADQSLWLGDLLESTAVLYRMMIGGQGWPIPLTWWSFRKYCSRMSDTDWSTGLTNPIELLIKTKKCPAYVLQSKLIIGK